MPEISETPDSSEPLIKRPAQLVLIHIKSAFGGLAGITPDTTGGIIMWTVDIPGAVRVSVYITPPDIIRWIKKTAIWRTLLH